MPAKPSPGNAAEVALRKEIHPLPPLAASGDGIIAGANYVSVFRRPEAFVLELVGGTNPEVELAVDQQEKDALAAKEGNNDDDHEHDDDDREPPVRPAYPGPLPHHRCTLSTPDRGQWSATLWILNPDSTYVVRLYAASSVFPAPPQARRRDSDDTLPDLSTPLATSANSTSSTGTSSTAEQVVNSSDKRLLFSRTVRTTQSIINGRSPLLAMQLMDFSDHLLHPHFRDCIVSQPTDYSLLVAPFHDGAAVRSPKFLMLLKKFFMEALFILPHTDVPQICTVPNPQKRYCIDLRPASPPPNSAKTSSKLIPTATVVIPESLSNSEPQSTVEGSKQASTPCASTTATEESKPIAVRWDASRKMRRELPNVRLTCNRQFAATLSTIAANHEERGKGMWLVPNFIAALNAMQMKTVPAPSGSSTAGTSGKSAGFNFQDLNLLVFELWDVTGKKLLAAVAGFALGAIFHDFSMSTFDRSGHHCYGTLLTKVVGDLLTKAGYKLWYWGMKLGYMKDFEGPPPHGYGGVEIPRKEFLDLWSDLRQQSPTTDPASLIRSGAALVAPL